MDQSVADFYGIDLKKLAADAQASGFNPLTIIRNGGLAAYMLPVNPLAAAPTDLVEYGGGELDVGGGGRGGGGGGGDFFSYAYFDDWNGKTASKAARASWDQAEKANSVRVYEQQVEELFRSVGVPIAPPTVNGGSGPGSPRVRTSTTPAPSEPKMKDGFQQKQVWDKDKQPSVIVDSTFHYIMPGVSWEERGGVTRGAMWEEVYGEDNPLSIVMALPKWAGDFGHNVARLNDWGGSQVRQGFKLLDAVVAGRAAQTQSDINAQPTYRDSSGRVTFQEPSNIGLSAGSNSVRPTLSYAASKEASKSSSTVTKAPSASTKDKDKEKASTPSSSSTSSKTKSSSSSSKSDSKSGSGSSKKKK